MKIKRWQVAKWRRGNIGGTDLVLNTDGETFVSFATGPTPWGSGSWGPFPLDVVSEVRALQADDSWLVSGAYERRWTARDLLRALKNAAHMSGSTPAMLELKQAIATAESAA